MEAAMSCGDLDEVRAHYSLSRADACDDTTRCSLAAYYGQLRILKWLRANGYGWNENTCRYAARYGYMHVLQWAHEHGAPWSELVCEDAVHGCELEVLKWLRANGCPWDKTTCMSQTNNSIFAWISSGAGDWGTHTKSAAPRGRAA